MGNRDEASGDGISIPYGAIKRISHFLAQINYERFQFLMVRLKGFIKVKIMNKYIISIPYGAIKRDYMLLFL